MNVSWVLASSAAIPLNDINLYKNIGSLWGSWKTWKTCQTDNAVCHDPSQAITLIQTDFADKCNFYVPESFYKTLETPKRIKAYGGEFSHTVIDADEIVSMHLASTVSDIVLLFGFNWIPPSSSMIEPALHYAGMVYHIIKSTPKTQWVYLDPASKLDPELIKLENFTTDSLSSVFELLSN